MKAKCAVLIFMVSGLLLSGPVVYAASADHALYASLLSRHVKNGLVDYRGVKDDEALLDQYLDVLAAVDPESLTADRQFAFYANAYNAWTIKLILSRYPEIQSIKELGSLFKSPWKKKIARIDGDLLTLDQIEHDILRKRFKDARVHFAVNCASKSCPPLQGEPFSGDRLDQQLNHAARAFINDARFNRLEGDTLWVSKIFDWFAQDFNNDVIGYFIQFADPPLADQLVKNKARIRVRYLDYDWTLNGK
jgi:hypothetical protein